jgi:hypothetical protein
MRGVQHSVAIRFATMRNRTVVRDWACLTLATHRATHFCVPVGFRRNGTFDRNASATRDSTRDMGAPLKQAGRYIHTRARGGRDKHVSDSNQCAMRRVPGAGVTQQDSRWHKGLNVPGIAVAISTSQGMRCRPVTRRESHIRKAGGKLRDFVGAAGEANASYEGRRGH